AEEPRDTGPLVYSGPSIVGPFNPCARYDTFSPDRRAEQAGREHRFSIGDEEGAPRCVERGLDLRQICVRFVVKERLQESGPFDALDSEQGRTVEVWRRADGGRPAGPLLAG